MTCSNIGPTNITEHLLCVGCVIGSGDTIMKPWLPFSWDSSLRETEGGREIWRERRRDRGRVRGERNTVMIKQHLLIY